MQRQSIPWRTWRRDAACDDAGGTRTANARQTVQWATVATKFEAVGSEVSGILRKGVSRIQRELQIGIEPEGKPDARRPIQA
jgi:hypothetical protein